MTSADSYDVAIIGGGPAGSTAAYLLAENGYRVILLEKKTFPRRKVCAGLLTWKTLHGLKRIFDTPLAELKKNGIITDECSRYRIFFKEQTIAHGKLDYPFHFIRREAYDHFWLEKAHNQGAQVRTGVPVISIDTRKGIVTAADGCRIQAKVIIGADGIWSCVRKALGLSKTYDCRWRHNLAMTIEAHIPQNKHHHRFHDSASLHFGYVPWGYAWSFPNKEHHIVGMASLGSRDSMSLIQSFRRFRTALGYDDKEQPRLQSHPLPYGNFNGPAAKDKVLLVGDACGLADPLLGEGIFYAHRSAELAVRAVLDSGSDLSKAGAVYQKILDRELLRELRWIKFYRTMIFLGGRHRRFRGVKLFFRWIPKRLEAAVQGQGSFARLLTP